MTTILILIGVVALLIVYIVVYTKQTAEKIAQLEDVSEARRIDIDNLTARIKAESEMRESAKKIRSENEDRKADIRTGDDSADFDRSIELLNRKRSR